MIAGDNIAHLRGPSYFIVTVSQCVADFLDSIKEFKAHSTFIYFQRNYIYMT